LRRAAAELTRAKSRARAARLSKRILEAANGMNDALESRISLAELIADIISAPEAYEMPFGQQLRLVDALRHLQTAGVRSGR
jgi:hypothetical protein